MEEQKKLTGYSSIETTDTLIRDNFDDMYYPADIYAKITTDTNMKMIDFVRRANVGYEDTVSLLYFGLKITYREVFANVERYAKALKRVNKWLKRCGNEHILRKGYGMCECGGSSVTSQVVCNVLGTAGVPTPHVTIASFDLITEKERGYNQRGELRVITPCRMLCYYNRIEETKKRLHTDTDGNTWVCTGDMGFVSEDGNITVCGRISDSYTNEKMRRYIFSISNVLCWILTVFGSVKQLHLNKTKKQHTYAILC